MRTTLLVGLAALSLAQVAGCPLVAETTVPGVIVKTSLGEFVIELDPENAPLAVTNFLQYADENFYDGTYFHDVVRDSLVEGGGYTLGLVQKETRDPIPSEADNGLLNVRASIAMARTSDPDSATSQFYVNLDDNSDLDPTTENPGYTVFGQVIEGMSVIDAIAAVPTGERDGMSDVPDEYLLIEDVQRTDIVVGDAAHPGVRIDTTLGTFVVQLDPERAPRAVENFLQYTDDGFYAGTVFHRVIEGFVVQGGGFTPGLRARAPSRAPIPNESANGISNIRGTVAMAWEDDPNSAATQFYVNASDNLERDATTNALGYAVFGRVVEGMDVVDAIAALPTESRDGLANVPTEDAIIEDIEITELPGGIELTPEGEEYLETQRYRVLTVIRELLVDLLSFGIQGAFG